MSRIRSILLVCSGNTCRSPMAAAILAKLLGDEPGLDVIEVGSAGTSAWDGLPATEGAYLVAMERGLDLSGHRSRVVTREMLRETDLVLTMTREHRERVKALGGEGKTYTLAEYGGTDHTPPDVPDPFGDEVAAYREVAATLDQMLRHAVVRLRNESG